MTWLRYVYCRFRYGAVSAALLVAVALMLGGCETLGTGSIAGGECKVMNRPPYVVQGKAAYDQNWIDNEVEGGVGACGWKRPAPRPAALDAAPARKVAAPPARRGLVARAKDRARSIWPSPSAVPSAPLPEPVPVVAEPPPPVKPRSAIDELLDPAPVRRVYP